MSQLVRCGAHKCSQKAQKAAPPPATEEKTIGEDDSAKVSIFLEHGRLLFLHYDLYHFLRYILNKVFKCNV